MLLYGIGWWGGWDPGIEEDSLEEGDDFFIGAGVHAARSGMGND
jgi:hypothetical protein